MKNPYFVIDKHGGVKRIVILFKIRGEDDVCVDLMSLFNVMRRGVMRVNEKIYQKPVIGVVEYTLNQAVSACGTSQYVQCLIGSQELVFYSSCSGGEIDEFYEYTVDGVTYIIWKYNYGYGPGEKSGTYWDILDDWLDDNTDESDDGLGWHIGYKTSFENLYGNS